MTIKETPNPIFILTENAFAMRRENQIGGALNPLLDKKSSGGKIIKFFSSITSLAMNNKNVDPIFSHEANLCFFPFSSRES